MNYRTTIRYSKKTRRKSVGSYVAELIFTDDDEKEDSIMSVEGLTKCATLMLFWHNMIELGFEPLPPESPPLPLPEHYRLPEPGVGVRSIFP